VTAEYLRETAHMMRSLVIDLGIEMSQNRYWAGDSDAAYTAGVEDGLGGNGGQMAGRWTPGVASAVALWLDFTAHHHSIASAPTGGGDYYSYCTGCQKEIDEIEQCPDFASALAVAKAYRRDS
jgi:hypothetical protein